MSDYLAMARPGTQFSGDGISISWPRRRDGTDGTRDVVELPSGKRSGRIKRMIVEGAVDEVKGPATVQPSPAGGTSLGGRKLFAGGSREALRAMREPAGPVVRDMFVPAGDLVSEPMEAAVIEPDPDGEERRPAPPVTPDETAWEKPAPEPTLEERIAEKADGSTLADLQGEARGLGLKAVDVDGGWADKPGLSKAILAKSDAAAEGESDAPAADAKAEAEPAA